MNVTRVTSLVSIAALACLANGCSFGVTAGKYNPAQQPGGVTVVVETGQGQPEIRGELIEVRDAGIVVLTFRTQNTPQSGLELRLLPYTAILTSKVSQTESRYAISKRMAPKPEVRERLRLLSRFPQGLTPELTQQLLAAYGQTELAGVTP